MNTPDMSALRPNKGKKLIIETDNGRFARYPVKTHVVKKGDDLKELMDTYVKPYLTEGDYKNIKITTPDDVVTARGFLSGGEE